MPTKKKTTYAVSRAKLAKKIDVLSERLQEFDIYTSTYGEIEDLVTNLESELTDLSYEVTAEK
jgi:hypothetical protein